MKKCKTEQCVREAIPTELYCRHCRKEIIAKVRNAARPIVTAPRITEHRGRKVRDSRTMGGTTEETRYADDSFPDTQ